MYTQPHQRARVMDSTRSRAAGAQQHSSHRTPRTAASVLRCT